VRDVTVRHARELRPRYGDCESSLMLLSRYEADIAPEPLHYVVQAALA